MTTFFYSLVALAMVSFIFGAYLLFHHEKPQFLVTKDFIRIPHHLTADELGVLEGGLPGLFQILVIANRIEDPAGKLDKAVVSNLKKGIPYIFLISQSEAEQEIDGYFKIFEKYAELANPDRPTADLVKIKKLDMDWNDYPYVFYFLRGPSREAVVAYQGTQIKEGIADDYRHIDGHVVAAILTTTLFKAKDIEPAIKPRHNPTAISEDEDITDTTTV